MHAAKRSFEMNLKYAAGALVTILAFTCPAFSQTAAQPAAPAAAAKPAPAKPAAAKPAAKPAASAAQAPAETRMPAEAVVAIVNDQLISTYDLDQRAGLILLSSGIRPTPEVMQQIEAQALRSLEDERLQMQEIRSRKMSLDPKDVDAALENVARNARTTVPVLKTQLAAAGVNINTLRDQIEAQLAWNRLMSGLYGSRLRISDAQVQDTLARVAANAMKPQYLVSVIYLPAESPAELTEAQTAGTRLVDELKKGANFAMVARQFSAAPSAATGGDLDWLAQDELRPVELQRVAAGMKAGDLAGPIPAPGGVYIISLRDKRAGVDPQAASKVTLKQITAEPNQQAALDRARQLVKGCPSVDAAISGVTGLTAADLGEVQESELTDEMRKQVADTATGAASASFQSGGKLRALVVCARDTSGGALPSRDEIESRLVDQELAMLSQRYLRNLRREAAIVRR